MKTKKYIIILGVLAFTAVAIFFINNMIIKYDGVHLTPEKFLEKYKSK